MDPQQHSSPTCAIDLDITAPHYTHARHERLRCSTDLTPLHVLYFLSKVVGGVVASPFAVNHRVPDTFYSLVRAAYKLSPTLTQSSLVKYAVSNAHMLQFGTPHSRVVFHEDRDAIPSHIYAVFMIAAACLHVGCSRCLRTGRCGWCGGRLGPCAQRLHRAALKVNGVHRGHA